MKTNQQIAVEVIAGKWSTGEERKQLLKEAGYDPSSVQSIVNALMSGAELAVQTGDYVEVEIDLKTTKGIKVTFV